MLEEAAGGVPDVAPDIAVAHGTEEVDIATDQGDVFGVLYEHSAGPGREPAAGVIRVCAKGRYNHFAVIIFAGGILQELAALGFEGGVEVVKS